MDPSADTAEPSRPVGLAIALLVLLSGAYGVGFWALRDRGPPPEAFAPAARVVLEGHRAGDLVLLVPFYATRAREELGHLLPVAPSEPLREDLRAAPRIWVFGLFGEAERLAPELARAGLAAERAWDPAPGIRVELWAWPPGEAWREIYDFRAHLQDASVVHEHSDGTRERCGAWSSGNGQGAPDGGRWACPHDAEWFYVSPEWHRMGDHPRWCFWAHPPTDGRLVVHFPRVPMTGHLVGRAGHTLNSSVHARARIDLDVTVGDAAPQRFAIGLTEHWRPFMLTTPATGTATVSFAISTPDAGTNHFCFTASMREAPWDERAPQRRGPHRWRAPR